MARTSSKQKLFTGRDHSWMQFNRRVLEEAEDPSNPLLERVKFLAITGSNLDEYVEVRQAGLMQRIEDGYREPGYDGLRPDESLAILTADIHSFVDAQYTCWNKQLLPELGKQGIRLLECVCEIARGLGPFPSSGRLVFDISDEPIAKWRAAS